MYSTYLRITPRYPAVRVTRLDLRNLHRHPGTVLLQLKMTSPRQWLPGRGSLLDFLRGMLTSFQSTGSMFEVVCTIQRGRDGPPQPPIPIRPKTRPRRLIVLDSSFNPPTLAHMRMAESALRDAWSAGGSRLLLLLAVNNADKKPKPAAFEQRLAMMVAFAQDIHTQIASWQPSMPGDQKEDLFIDLALTTLPYFHAKSAAIASSHFYRGQDGTGVGPEQVFLVGYDTLIRIFNPKYYGVSTATASRTPMQDSLSPFFDRASLRVAMRTDDAWGGSDEQTMYVDSLLNGDALERTGGRREWAARVQLVGGKQEEPVSSTLARRVAERKDWQQLAKQVGPEVRQWIVDENLYAEGG